MGSRRRSNRQRDPSPEADPQSNEDILRALIPIMQHLAAQTTSSTAAASSTATASSAAATSSPAASTLARSIPLPKLAAPEELTIPSFRDWKVRWNDYANAQQLTSLPLTTQHGALRSALHSEWTILWQSGRIQISDSTSVTEAVSALEGYLRQKRNPLLDRQAFHRRDQQAGESVDRYFAALKELDDACAHDTEFKCESCGDPCTIKCGKRGCGKPFALANFQQQIRIRDRLICGLLDKEMQRKVLAERFSSELSLDRVLAICISHENATSVGATLSPNQANQATTAEAYAASGRPQSSYKKQSASTPAQATTKPQQQFRKPYDPNDPCAGCGVTPQHPRFKCPAKDKTCNNCGIVGHYSKVCRRIKKTPSPKPATASQVDEQQPPATSNTVVAAGVRHELIVIDTVINQTVEKIRWLPDPGSEPDLIPESEFQLLGEAAQAAFNTKEVDCVGANNITLGPCGSFTASFHLNGRVYQTTVGVCKYLNAPLLSKAGCIALGLLPENWPYCMVKPPTANVILNGQVKTVQPRTPASPNIDIQKASILDQHAAAFDDAVLRPMHGPPMTIELVEGAVPCKRYRAYNVPFHWREPVRAQLDSMLEKGIIEPVPVGEAIDWCHPMVVVPKKGSSEPRVTVDLTGLNKYVRRPAYPVKVPREVVARIPPGMRYFTTLDARHGYWQVLLDESSKKLTTFITPWGSYRYCRNVMGLSSAGDEHNRRGDEALFGIQNVEKVVEDIIIFDSDYDTHLRRVQQVIGRCNEHGITLNKKKFIFAQPEVDWCGYRINESGYTPSPSLYTALLNFPVPTNKTDVRSFNGLVQQFEAFSHRITELSGPIRSLLSAKAAFVWEEPHQRAFEDVIRELCSPRILAQFSPGQPLRLETDAAQSRGLGYALYQRQRDESWRLLQVGSRYVTPAESRYSATEIELLAVVWAVRKCKLFLLGSEFELIVDHRPLIPILNSHTLDEVDNPRLLRLKEKLASYLITAVWRPGKKHTVVDVFSRYPASSPGIEDIEDHPDSDPAPLIVAAVTDREDGSQILVDPLIKKVQDLAKWDSEQRRLREAITRKVSKKGDLEEDLMSYWKVLPRLSICDELIFMGSRIVVPKPLRTEILQALHASHQGQDRTLRRAGQSVYWPGITNDIRNVVKSCSQCSAYLPSQQKEPLISDPLPTYPFQHVATDIFSHAGYEYLVMVDRFSGWTNVSQCGRAPTSITVIRHLQRWMTDFGIPEKLTSDNGPQFSSSEFRNWATRWNIEHTTSSPHYPQSNGLAESAVKAIKFLVGKTTTNGNLKCDAFLEGLMELRNTPRADGRSPAQLVFGSPTRTKLPLHRSQFAKEWKSRASECDQRATVLREKAKQRYDARSKPLTFLQPGTIVLVQDHRSKQWTLLAEVLELLPRGRSYLIRTESGRILRRNRRFLRPFTATTEDDQLITENGTTSPRRSTRVRQPPKRFSNFVGSVPSPDPQRGHEICLNITHGMPGTLNQQSHAVPEQSGT